MKTVTIRTYTRTAIVSNPQTKEQKTSHKISIPFLGTWTVSDRVVRRMAENPTSNHILGKTFSKESISSHFATLEK